MIHRFIGAFPLDVKQFWISDGELEHQAREVLRLKPGEEIILSDGKGREARAEIISYDRKAMEVKILEVGEGINEPKAKAVLYLAILKRENFELAVQKAVEAGVSKIVPIITKRTIKLGLKKERLDKIIKEAAEQSGRSVLPELGGELNFKEAVADAKTNNLNIFFTLGAKPLDAKKDLSGKSVGIFIGPEGGWDKFETESAKAAKFVLAGLGNLVLRAETAAIIGVYETLRSRVI